MPNTDRDPDTRYGHQAGSGRNEPKRHERKERDPDWTPRQGGDQTRTGDGEEPSDDGADRRRPERPA